jgi:predicted phage-related endonuclease
MIKDSSVGKTGDWVVTWREQMARKLDIDKMKKEAPEIYEKFLKESPSRVLRVNKNEKGD